MCMFVCVCVCWGVLNREERTSGEVASVSHMFCHLYIKYQKYCFLMNPFLMIKRLFSGQVRRGNVLSSRSSSAYESINNLEEKGGTLIHSLS